MVLASYVGLRYEATADSIHVHDRTSVYRTDNKFFVIFSISSAEALFVCMPSVLLIPVTDISLKSGFTTTCLEGTP